MAIKTLEELATKLNELYPTRYSHFENHQEPPFLVYVDQGEENFHADNKVLIEGTFVDVEFYSRHKDLTAERRIKDLFRHEEVLYDKSDTIFIEDQSLFMTVFTVKLINKYKTLEEL